jgi:hypothetical protein
MQESDATEDVQDLSHGLRCVGVAQYDVHAGLEHAQGDLCLTSHNVFSLQKLTTSCALCVL